MAQQREQWTDGANTLALAPGVITLYDRNVATADELDRRGWRVIAAEDVLLGREEVSLDAGIENLSVAREQRDLTRPRRPALLVAPPRPERGVRLVARFSCLVTDE